ncbi:MAG: BPSS1780 family membrane protein [Aquincola sp.]|nr:BPSS1780 family membrane protein [Aquincola sp.]MDH4289132.1 BPSS1780 family membrane protein [Aquincola sp.]
MQPTAREPVRPIAIHSVDPGRSVGWWSEALNLFLRDALRWAALGVVLMVGFGLLDLLPLVGALVAALLSPVFLGGWMLVARKVHGGGTLDAMGLFAGFRGTHLWPLLTLGAWLAGATLLMALMGHALGLGAFKGAVAIDAPADAAALVALNHGMLALLLMLTFSLLVTAALWFSPALVVLHGASPLKAVRASLRAVLDNGLTFLLFGVVQLLLAAVASLPYHIGWVVLLPLMLLTAYVSYGEVFEP